MRYFIFTLLFYTSSAFSQGIDTLYLHQDAEQTILKNKWYLNALIISELGWNDSSTLITSVPSKNFIRFHERMEFGRDGETGENSKSTFKYYRLVMDDSISGTIQVYDTKNEFRKDENATYYYIQFNSAQLYLTVNEPSVDPLKDLGGTRKYIFSRSIDAEQLTAAIFGNWAIDSLQNILLIPSGEEVLLRKTVTPSMYKVNQSYYFGLYDGEIVCLSDCFSIPKVESNISRNINTIRSRGYAPDPYYVGHQFGEPIKFAVDIEKRLLIFFAESNRVCFDIVGVTENQLLLKKR